MLSLYLSVLDSVEDESKFERLYHAHKRTMLYTAYHILKDYHLAEDAVHEAFIRIAKNFHKVEEIESPRTRYFSVVIARNAALTMLKKENRIILLEDVADATEGTSELVEETVLNQIQYERAVSAIAGLSHTYKDILFLHYIQEYRLTEIAGLLGLDLEVVKKRAQRGKKKLLEVLAKGECADENAEAGH